MVGSFEKEMAVRLLAVDDALELLGLRWVEGNRGLEGRLEEVQGETEIRRVVDRAGSCRESIDGLEETRCLPPMTPLLCVYYLAGQCWLNLLCVGSDGLMVEKWKRL